MDRVWKGLKATGCVVGALIALEAPMLNAKPTLLRHYEKSNGSPIAVQIYLQNAFGSIMWVESVEIFADTTLTQRVDTQQFNRCAASKLEDIPPGCMATQNWRVSFRPWKAPEPTISEPSNLVVRGNSKGYKIMEITPVGTIHQDWVEQAKNSPLLGQVVCRVTYRTPLGVAPWVPRWLSRKTHTFEKVY